MSDIPVFGYLNYKGSLGDKLGEVMGPNLFGEMFVVTEQHYDPHNNTTRLGFSLERLVQRGNN